VTFHPAFNIALKHSSVPLFKFFFSFAFLMFFLYLSVLFFCSSVTFHPAPNIALKRSSAVFFLFSVHAVCVFRQLLVHVSVCVKLIHTCVSLHPAFNIALKHSSVQPFSFTQSERGSDVTLESPLRAV
jgi:hypothetical protein